MGGDVMSEKNKVIAGDFEGQIIILKKNLMFIGPHEINKESVERYEVINEQSTVTTFTKGYTKKSMIGAGTKGAVGAAIGTVIAPGIGTLIGAGAGVSTAKSKNKSLTNEVTTKDLMVAIYFANGEQSLVKIDGTYYEKFLTCCFREPSAIPQKVKEKKQKDPTKNNQVIKALGWVFFPYIMMLAFWNKLSRQNRILGGVWSIIALIAVIQGQLK
jgi:hypothetical protein